MQKLPNGFSGNVGIGPVNKCLNFGGDPDHPDHHLDIGIVFLDSSLLGDTESG